MSQHISIGDHKVSIKDTKIGEYLSITDLARLVNKDTSRVISKWLEIIQTIDFLDTWERNYNPDYHQEGYQALRLKAGVPQFYLSPKKWIQHTNAIGIETKSGRYGGTFAHHLIALEFCSTMDADFRFKVYKEYSELKQNQAVKWLQKHDFFLRKMEDNALENNRLAQSLRDDIKELSKE